MERRREEWKLRERKREGEEGERERGRGREGEQSLTTHIIVWGD